MSALFVHNGGMKPKWLLPPDTQTFETQSSGLSLVVQENARGEVYYRFAAPTPEVPTETLAQGVPALLADEPLTAEC